MAILVTGGAGYIGSHALAELMEQHESVVLLDNLKTGHSEAVSTGCRFYQGTIGEGELLHTIFREHEIEAVIHFAGSSQVAESVLHPLQYYENNLLATKNLLSAMIDHGVNKIVFSSSAAVYGEPKQIPIQETDPTEPTNAYGETKLAIEKMLKWCDAAYGIKWISLRYFNAAGAHSNRQIGEDHTPETHLIPIILEAALGKRTHVDVFGDDYPTKDGSCIRDYIHVMDLAAAHLKALQKLRQTSESGIYNLGTGSGYSVKEIIDIATEITNKPIKIQIKPRRKGDPAVLVASCDKAMRELSWKPVRSLTQMIQDAWNWHMSHPNGYKM